MHTKCLTMSHRCASSNNIMSLRLYSSCLTAENNGFAYINCPNNHVSPLLTANYLCHRPKPLCVWFSTVEFPCLTGVYRVAPAETVRHGVLVYGSPVYGRQLNLSHRPKQMWITGETWLSWVKVSMYGRSAPVIGMCVNYNLCVTVKFVCMCKKIISWWDRMCKTIHTKCLNMSHRCPSSNNIMSLRLYSSCLTA